MWTLAHDCNFQMPSQIYVVKTSVGRLKKPTKSWKEINLIFQNTCWCQWIWSQKVPYAKASTHLKLSSAMHNFFCNVQAVRCHAHLRPHASQLQFVHIWPPTHNLVPSETLQPKMITSSRHLALTVSVRLSGPQVSIQLSNHVQHLKIPENSSLQGLFLSYVSICTSGCGNGLHVHGKNH